MFLVGLTGGIATGKSSCSKMFRALGVPVIDADAIARRVVQPRKRAWKRIRETFGEEVFYEDGRLNRDALGNIIFENTSKRQQLNRIVHPEVFREMCWEIMLNFLAGYKFVILDVPLLYETGMWEKYLGSIIVISCEKDLQLQRLMHRNSLTEVEAMSRINSQIPLAEKCSKANYVIENSGSLEETKRQVVGIYGELNRSKAYLKRRIYGIAILTLLAGVVSAIVSWVLSKMIA